MQTIHITDFLSEAWAIFKKNPGLAIGGLVLYTVITFVGGIIPIIGYLFSIFVGPALMGGYVLFFLKFAKEDNPEINNLFEGFNRYGALLGIYWLMILAMLVIMLPTIILGIILAAAGIGEFLIIFIGLANLIAVIYVFIRYSMAYFILMDDKFIGVFDALKRSEKLTKGYYLSIFLFGIVMAVIGMVSFLLLILPYFVAAPVLGIAGGRLYLRLKQINGGEEIETEITPLTPPPPPTMAPPQSQIENPNEPPTMPPPEDIPPPDEGETK